MSIEDGEGETPIVGEDTLHTLKAHVNTLILTHAEEKGYTGDDLKRIIDNRNSIVRYMENMYVGEMRSHLGYLEMHIKAQKGELSETLNKIYSKTDSRHLKKPGIELYKPDYVRDVVEMFGSNDKQMMTMILESVSDEQAETRSELGNLKYGLGGSEELFRDFEATEK